MMTKSERIEAMRKARTEVVVGARLALNPDLRGACESAARVLDREIVRVSTLPDDPAAILASMERVSGLVTTSLGMAVRAHESEARLVGVANTPFALAVACSET